MPANVQICFTMPMDKRFLPFVRHSDPAAVPIPAPVGQGHTYRYD
jgi:hypothetical protein